MFMWNWQIFQIADWKVYDAWTEMQQLHWCSTHWVCIVKLQQKNSRNYYDERDRGRRDCIEPFVSKNEKHFSARPWARLLEWFGVVLRFLSVCVLALIAYFFQFNSRCGISIWNRNQTKRIESNSIQSKTSTTHNKLNVIHISVYQVFYWLSFTIFFRIKLRIYANIVITRSFDYFCCSALFSNSNWSYCFRHRCCLRDVSLAFDCIVGCANLKKARV